MNNQHAIATASLWASIHTLRFMVNRGLVSPNEVDEVYGSICEAMRLGDPTFAAETEVRLEKTFLEMKGWAEKLWIGKGKSNPR